jgi:hypothetical protein
MDFAKFLAPLVSRTQKSRAGAEAMARMMGGTVPQEEDVLVVQGKAPPQAPAADPFGEFLTTLVGGKPQGGYQDNGVQGGANFLRNLLGGGDSADFNTKRMDSMTANELASAKKAAVRGEEFDGLALDEIASTADPVYAANRQKAIQEGIDNERKAKYRAAVAAGDMETASKIDPMGVFDIQGEQDKRDEVRRGSVARMAQAARAMGGDFAANFQKLAATAPQGMITPEEMALAAGGYEAISRGLQGAPDIKQVITTDNRALKTVNADGSVTDLGETGYADPLDAAYKQAQIDATNALAADRRANDGKGTGDNEILGTLALVDQALNQIEEGKKAGALKTNDKGAVGNILSGDNPIGRTWGEWTGDSNESKRQIIDQTAAALLSSFVSMSENMSSKMFDSNAEKELWMQQFGKSGTSETREEALRKFRIHAASRLSGGKGITAPPAPKGGGIPMMNTPAEAAKLPPGTVFTTPDGKIRMVPK